MILKRLELMNIRSYKDEVINFPLGTTLFEGDIGSGKSTILMAIEFALFGLGSERGAALIRVGARHAKVRLSFELNGATFEIERKLIRKGKGVQQEEGILIQDGKKLILSPSELKEKILDILGFNEPPNPNAQSLIFRYAVFTPQEEMKAIIILNPDDRLRTLRKAFGLEEYKVAVENVFDVAGIVDERARAFEERSSDLEEVGAEYEAKKAELQRLFSEVEGAKKSELSLRKTLDSLQLEESDLLEARERLARLEAVVPELRSQIERLLSDMSVLEKEISDLESRLSRELQLKLTLLMKVEKPTEADETELDSKLSQLRDKERSDRERRGELEKMTKDYLVLQESGMCPTCGRPIESLEIAGKLEEVRRELAEVDMRLQAYETRTREIDETKLKLRSFRESQDEARLLKEEVDEILARVGKLKASYSELKKRFEAKRTQLQEVEEKIGSEKALVSKIRAVEDSITRVREELEEATRNVAGLSAQVDRSKMDKARLEAEISEKEAMRRKAARLKSYRIWLEDFFAPAVSEIEKRALAELNQEFEQLFQKWFGILVDDPDKEVRLDEEFSPIVEQDGYEQDIRYMSGGERTSVALAYRLALNTVVQRVSTGLKSNLLILDEPTDGFSREQLYKVRDILKELSCPQVILVSHERELEGFADEVFRVEKVDGISSVSSFP